MSLKGCVRKKAERAPTRTRRTRPGSEGVAGARSRAQGTKSSPPSLPGALAARPPPVAWRTAPLRAAPARSAAAYPPPRRPRGARAAGASASPGPPGARCPPPSRCLGDAAAELPRRSRYGGREGTQLWAERGREEEALGNSEAWVEEGKLSRGWEP